MNQEEPTMMLALKTWWAMMWRTIPLAILGGALSGVVLGIFGAIIGLERNLMSGVGGVVGMLIGAYITIYVIKRLMTKGFGQYRLVVVKK